MRKRSLHLDSCSVRYFNKKSHKFVAISLGMTWAYIISNKSVFDFDVLLALYDHVYCRDDTEAERMYDNMKFVAI